MIYLNNFQKVCWKHIILLSFIQLLFVFFAQGAMAKSKPSEAVVGDDGCNAPAVYACSSGVLTCFSLTVVLNATSNTPNAIYSWSGPNAFASTIKNPVVNFPGIYMVTVTDPTNGCSTSTSVEVVKNIVPPANVTVIASGTINSTSAYVVLKGTSSTQNVSYEWSGLNGFFSYDQETIVVLPGTYILTVTNPVNGCSTSESVLVVHN